jgi:hypothetical protein
LFLPPTQQFDAFSRQAQNNNCLSGASCIPPPPSVEGQTSSLTPPLATLGFSLWDKFHRKRQRFRCLVVADRPHTATSCCDPCLDNKDIAINTCLIYTELFYGRENVFELRIHLNYIQNRNTQFICYLGSTSAESQTKAVDGHKAHRNFSVDETDIITLQHKNKFTCLTSKKKLLP